MPKASEKSMSEALVDEYDTAVAPLSLSDAVEQTETLIIALSERLDALREDQAHG